MPFFFNPFTGKFDYYQSATSTNSFVTWQPPNGTAIVADSSSDTATLTSSDSSINISGNSTTDTLDFTLPIVSIAKGGSGASNALTLLTTTGNINAMPIATNYIRYTTTTTTNINGIANDGTARRIYIESAGAGITIVNESASASASDRLALPGGGNIYIPPGFSIFLQYNTTESRWRLADFKSPISVLNSASTYTFYNVGAGPFTGTNTVVLGNEAVSTNNPSVATSVILGYRAGRNIGASPGVSNLVIIGNGAGAALSGGSANSILIGTDAGKSITTGTNFLIGPLCGDDINTGTSNVGFGSGCLGNVTTGSSNIGIGISAGGVNVTGSSNICIGTAAQPAGGFTALTNMTVIGQNARPTQSNVCILGGSTSPQTVGIGLDTVNTAYKLDVAGSVNCTAGYYINGVQFSPGSFWSVAGNALNGTEILGSTNYSPFLFYSNNTERARLTEIGLLGVAKTGPTASLHVGVKAGTISGPSNITASLSLQAATGYAFGSGNKSYSQYSVITVSGTTVFSATNASTTFTEPANTDFDPTSGSASDVDSGGGGYDPNIDSPPSYAVYALYAGDTIQSVNTASFSLAFWTDTNPKYVNLTWTAPVGSQAPSNYYIYRGGTDYQITASTSFQDTNSGWTPSGGPGLPSVGFYNVDLAGGGSVGAETYRTLNTTTGTFLDDTDGVLTDDGSWASGSTITPTTANYDSLYLDGGARLDGGITQYNSVATVSNGVPAEYATVDLTAQGAAIAATTMYAVPASGAGMYRVSWVATVTRAASTSSVLGGTNGFQVKYTDADDSVVKTSVATNSITSAANTTGTSVSGCLVAYCKASTNLQYIMDYTSVGGTSMQFNLHIKVEKM